MKRFGLGLLLLLVLLQAGTVFAEKDEPDFGWGTTSKQIETNLQAMLIATEVLRETVDRSWNEKAKQVETHAQTTSENASKEITSQKEAYVKELDETTEALIDSTIFESYQNEKQAELDDELESEVNAILISILSESKN